MFPFKRQPFWKGKERCYTILKCGAGDKCPAFHASDKPCWEIPETVCHCEYRRCEQCAVFIRYGKSRIKSQENLKHIVLRSKPFWTSLLLLALILLFTFVTFAKLSTYGGRLTSDYRGQQLSTVNNSVQSLAEFYGRLARVRPFLQREPGGAETVNYIYNQLPAADTSAVLAIALCSRGRAGLEPVLSRSPDLASFLRSAAGRPGAPDSTFLMTGQSDSLDRILVVTRIGTETGSVLVLTDANRVLKNGFAQAGVPAPLLYWILDSEGKMIRAPVQFGEDLMRSIAKKNYARCSGCHVSDYDEKLSARSGTHIVSYPPGKKSLIAWSAGDFAGQRWTLVMTLPSSDATGLLNDSLISTRLYLFFAIGVVALFLTFNFVNIHRQVLLETEKKMLQNNLAATEKIRKMENTLEKVQRMEGLSVLAGGLAHEINNPITNIVLYTRLVRQRVTDPDLLSDLEVIERESKKAKFIVFDMLSFIRRSYAGEKPESISLNGLINELVEIHARLFVKKGITVRHFPQPDLPLIMADGNKIMQVMVNILTNAMDAVRDQGVIKIETGAEAAEPGKAVVYFTISDNGAGILPEHVEKIFEPFYTTKPVGEGTGLGLPVSKAIIEKMGGRIHLSSIPGQGTTVKVILPVL